jgi:hypothetical protein
MFRKMIICSLCSLLLTSLVACAGQLAAIPTATLTLTPPPGTKTPPPSPSPEPSPTPKPAWQMTLEIQDSQDSFFKVIGGKPTIDCYDTPAQEKIALDENSIKITETTAILNPNILTAQDAEGNIYAFNPNYGWFKIPEVQMDYTKLEEYTEVDQAFVEDGRANITTAIKYAENPIISPDAVAPQFWANYGADGNSNFVYLSYYPSGNYGLAQRKWPDLITYFKPENKPFALTGFYKALLDNQ